MSKSITHVIDKLEEAEFFLQKMDAERLNITPQGVRHFQYYFGAFVSAARSVTFSMQCHCKEIQGFDTWYYKIQEELRSNKTARFFHELRNEMEKEGRNPATKGIVVEEGVCPKMEHYFDYEILGVLDRNAPEEAVVPLCKKYLSVLIELTDKLIKAFSKDLNLEGAGLDMFERSVKALAKQLQVQFPEHFIKTMTENDSVRNTFRTPIQARIAKLAAAYPY